MGDATSWDLPPPGSKASRPLLSGIHAAAPRTAEGDVRAAWDTPVDEQPRQRQPEVPLRAASSTARASVPVRLQVADPDERGPSARGDTVAVRDAHDDGHVQPRHAGAGPRGSRRMGTVLLAGEGGRTATTTATRDDSGRSPEGKRPGHRGGAEGTPTPDPHTAEAAGRGSRTSVAIHLRRSGESAVVREPLRTTVNAVRWPPSWHHAEAA
jgi:hypothetical protein